jgi:arginine decarboxylase
MKITLTTGVSEGPTKLAAFDAALLQAGICNYNLLVLSSVIPEGSVIEPGKFVAPPDDQEYGYRLYVVMAHCEVDEPGKEAWAGLGWVQEQRSSRGFFVEFRGETEAEVQNKIEKTLTAMTSSRGREYGPIQSKIIGIPCQGEPVCAMVVAVYKSEGWQ